MASQDAAILQEIARISGAINRAKAASAEQQQQQQHREQGHYANRGSRGGHYGHPRGSYRGRGLHAGPFRGSGAHYPHHAARQGAAHQPARANKTWIAPKATQSSSSEVPSSSKHRSLVINNAQQAQSASSLGADETEEPSASASAAPDQQEGAPQEHTNLEAASSSSGHVADKASNGHAKADDADADADMEDGEIDESKLPPPEPKKPPISVSKVGSEIIINGITFVADATGRKLVRKDLSATHDIKGKGKASSSSSAAAVSTPSKTLIDGQAFVRTKSGNLISAAVLKRRQELAAKKSRLDQLVGIVNGVQKARTVRVVKPLKKTTLCRFFQKTGVCARAKTCPYIHDPDKVSICPRFLRNKCPLPASACPLSHVPDPHRMPHCQHYPRCKKGEACPYTHAEVAADAKICKAFVSLGWCERGKDCTERHVWECPDFEEKGTCNNKNCKLGHVIRRKGAAAGASSEAPAADSAAFMFVDTEPDPAFTKAPDASTSDSKKRPAADGSDASSGEEEAASLVKKKAKIVPPKPKDGMQANDDFVTLVLSDTEDDEHHLDDESSEAESELHDAPMAGISRKIEPLHCQQGNEPDTDDSEQDSENEESPKHQPNDVEDSEETDDDGSDQGDSTLMIGEEL